VMDEIGDVQSIECPDLLEAKTTSFLILLSNPTTTCNMGQREYHIWPHTWPRLFLTHTTNTSLHDLNTSWCFQGVLNKQTHVPLKELYHR
jgi:hypothetical protein